MPLLADIHNNILCGTAAMWSSYNCTAGVKQDGYPIAATMTCACEWESKTDLQWLHLKAAVKSKSMKALNVQKC